MRYTLVLTTLALFAWGCGDDSGKKSDGPITQQDQSLTDGVVKDGGGGKEASATDIGTSKETASGSKSCKEVGECAKTCTDLPCVNSCLSQGCKDAQDKAQAMLACAIPNCPTECMGGFSTACLSCLEQKCKTTYDACNNHTSC